MQGYVQNEGTQAYFVCQRQIPPGGKVQITDIYKSVGKKSGLEEGVEFVEWIKTNVFRRGSWGYYKDEDSPLSSPKTAKKPTAQQKSVTKAPAPLNKTSPKKEKDARGAGRDLRRTSRETHDVTGANVTPVAIIEASYEQARGLIEKTKDRIVLKKALNLTKHFSGKEQHMRHIIKRLEQVY